MLDARALSYAGRLAPTDLALEAGTITCLIGPNGSGKTSLLQAIAEVGDAEGEVAIDGRHLHTVPPAARPRWLGYVPARRTLAWPLLSRDVIALGGATKAEVAEAIARFELDAFELRKVTELSTGERGRVLLARALAPHPRLLLLDEPTANLDPLWQLRLVELLREQVNMDRSAALVAMHDIDAALRFGDRLLVMANGSVVADGSPGEILNSKVIGEVFGIARTASGWMPDVRRSAGPRSSP